MKAGLFAPAKINLTLDVGPPDGGWHPVDSLVLPLQLADRLVARRARSPASLVVHPPSPWAPSGEGNLALAAARTLEAQRGPLPLAYSLRKRVPSGAGLGGGSSDAWAALRLADLALDLSLDQGALEGLAGGVGADVAVFGAAGPARVRGRGERVDRLSPAPRPVWAAVGTMGEPVDTAEAYGWLDAWGRTPGARTPEAVAAWEAGDVLAALAAAGNDFLEPVAARRPEVAAGLEAISESSPAGRGLSGSGNAVFGVYLEERGARAGAEGLERYGASFTWWGRVAA